MKKQNLLGPKVEVMVSESSSDHERGNVMDRDDKEGYNKGMDML